MRNFVILKNRNKFTLIELVVIIAIIAILASLVIPNTGDFKYKSYQTKVSSSIRSLQTVSDAYTLEHNGKTPTSLTPTLMHPQEIDFQLLFPKYVKNVPHKSERYWVDITGKVWESTVDAPYDVMEEEGAIKWSNNSEVIGYKLYQVIGGNHLSGSANRKTVKIKEVGSYMNVANTSVVQYTKNNPNEVYLVSAIDKYGFVTAPVGLGYGGSFAPITISDPNVTERTLYITTRSKAKAEWLAIEKEEYKPEGTDITYEFATSDDGVNYSDFTPDITSMDNSHFLKIKITLSRTGSESPILYRLKVVYRPENGDVVYFAPVYEAEEVIELEEEQINAEAVRPKPTIESGSIGSVSGSGTVSVPPNTNGTIVQTIDLGENTYISNIIPVISKSYGTNVRISYSTSSDGSTWSNSSYFPSTLPSGRYVRVEIEVSNNNGGVVIEPFIINKSHEKPEVLDLETAPPYEEDGEPKKVETRQWIEIDRFEVWQDANEVVEWTSVEGDVTISENTRVRYVLYTSQNGNSWSRPTEDITQLENSRFLKIEVISEQRAGVQINSYPDIREIFINYNTLEGEQKQVSYETLRPTAVISSPYKTVDGRYEVEWSYAGSTDPNSLEIVKAEWIINGVKYSHSNLPKKLSIGEHTIQLRVQNAYGLWSEWASKTVTVRANNQAPVAKINVSPSSHGTTGTQFYFTSASTDPDGDEIIDEQWENVSIYYPVGNHTIRLRVKDSLGAWSEWTQVTISVKDATTYSSPTVVPYDYKVGDNFLATNCDDCFYIIDLPFSFRFYDRNFNRVYVNNNGMLTFLEGFNKWANQPISDKNTPDYSISVFWDDLDYRQMGYIYYGNGGSFPNRYTIIEFRGPNHYNRQGNGIWASVIFYENGVVEMSYQDVSFGLSAFDKGASATVGIKKNSSDFHEYSYNSPVLYNGLALRYEPR